MQPVCFVLQWGGSGLDKEQVRQQAWPETLAALRSKGWRNYSLFRSDEGMLVGYLEASDVQKVRDCMAALEAEILCQNQKRGINVQVSFLKPVFHIT
jgi:L-rhamnose mutarotase